MFKLQWRGSGNPLYCRSFQTAMKAGNYFLGYRMPDYIEGAGAITRLGNLAAGKGLTNVLFVTDQNLLSIGLCDSAFESLKHAGIRYTVFADVERNPTSNNVEAGYAVYRQNGCNGFVALGGGASMDCAKAIAAKTVHPTASVAQLQGLLKVHAKVPLIIAIPTTAGTGSETTVASVIIDSETHHKASINDPSILPHYAILDPDLTRGLPPAVTATTGMDALAHAVESFTNHTYNTDLENFLAKEAVRLIHDNLLKAYENGNDGAARGSMLMAAFFAGRSFTRGCVGYVHAVGHTLGGLYGVPHGLAMSIILPHVLRQYGDAVTSKLAQLADVCDMEGTTEAQKAESFIRWIEEMKEKMNIPKGADMIKDEDVEQIITWAIEEANPLYPTPVTWDREDFARLIATLRKA